MSFLWGLLHFGKGAILLFHWTRKCIILIYIFISKVSIKKSLDKYLAYRLFGCYSVIEFVFHIPFRKGRDSVVSLDEETASCLFTYSFQVSIKKSLYKYLAYRMLNHNIKFLLCLFRTSDRRVQCTVMLYSNSSSK